jgi:hypothetical protein
MGLVSSYPQKDNNFKGVTVKVRGETPGPNQRFARFESARAVSIAEATVNLIKSARGGSRTPTPIKVQDPKSSASASFATLASRVSIAGNWDVSQLRHRIFESRSKNTLIQ